MKVYIITKEPFPNGMAATNRIKCYAKAIAKQGIKCEVLIFTRTEVYGKIPKNTVGKGHFDDIPFRYIGGTPLRGSNVLVRQLNDRLDRWRLLWYLRKNLKKGDVVFAYMGTFVDYSLKIIDITHKCGAFYLYDLCEYPYGTGAETKKVVRNRCKTLNKLYPLFDGVIPISDTLCELAKQYVNPKCQILKVPILVDYDKYNIENLSDKAEYPYIFHSGTLYEQKDGILGMIEAFGMAKQKLDREFRFVSTGKIENSPHATEIKRIISKYNIEKHIHFTGYLSDEELKDYLSKASLVIINKYRTQQNQYCFSTKLGEYLAASKPVIITNVGEAMNWLEDGVSAYIVEPENVNSLSNAIVKAFSDDGIRQRISLQGNAICRNCFDYRVWGEKITKMLYKCKNEIYE